MRSFKPFWVMLLAVAMTTITGCYIHEYCYSLDKEYVGLSDCEIQLFMQSVDYHQQQKTSENKKSFLFTVRYQCLAAAPQQRLEFSNVSASLLDGSERMTLALTDSTTWEGGNHILRFGPFNSEHGAPDSVLISFDMIVPEGMATGSPRTGHYETIGTLHDEKIGLYRWFGMWD